MAGYAQQVPSSWLANGRSRWKDAPVLPTLRAGAQLLTSQTIWTSWWLGAAPLRLSQGRALRSAWFMQPGINWSRDRPLLRPLGAGTSQQAADVTWNNWFWNTTFTPLQRLATLFQTGVYAYVGESSFLIFPHPTTLILDSTNYDYDGADVHADLAVSPITPTYTYAGGAANLILPASTLLVQATAIGWSIDPFSGIAYFRRPGDVFYVAARNFADASIDYLAGKPGSPFYGWMTVVPPGTPLTNPTGGGIPVYDFQSARRTVF